MQPIIANKIDALENFINLKEELKESHPLQYLFWEATLRCNLQCLHCGSDCFADNSTREDELSVDRIKKELLVVSQKYSPQDITFAIIGGEPLLRKGDIFTVGKYAAELGYHWGIVTNGTLLTQEVVNTLKQARLSTISVSLDGLAKQHDALRNKQGAFQQTLSGIKLLLQDRFWQRFDLICCVNKLNIDHLQEFVEEMKAIGMPAIRFAPIFSRGRAGDNSYLMLEDRDYRKLFTFIAEKRQIEKDIVITLDEEGYYGPEWECVVREQFHYCASGISIGTILHDGKVTGCPSVSRNFIEGSILDKPFLDIWNTCFEKYRHGRQAMFPEKCQCCEHWCLCEGGGFHLLDMDHSGPDCCLMEKVRSTESEC